LSRGRTAAVTGTPNAVSTISNGTNNRAMNNQGDGTFFDRTAF
jgi:hypothetical protein